MTKKFAKDSLVFAATSVACQLIGVARGFAIRRLVPPGIMGFWSLVGVVQGLLATFDLGSLGGASRDLPMMRGRSASPAETRIRSTTLWFTVGQNIVIGVLASLYLSWNWDAYVPWERIAGFVAVVMLISGSFSSCYLVFYSAAHAFVPLSKVLLIAAVVEGVSFPLVVYGWGLGGLMTAAVVTNGLTGVGLYLYARPLQLEVRKKLHPEVLKELLSFGFFLRVVDYPQRLFAMAGLLWVTTFMSVEALALFALARGFTVQVVDVGCRVGNVFRMRLLAQAGRGASRQSISAELQRFLLLQLLVWMPLLAWAAAVVVPFLVRAFIPQYADANEALIILLSSGFFYVLNSGLQNPWIIDKNLKARGITNMAGLLMMVAMLGISWFTLGRTEINDVAVSIVAGHFLYFVCMVISVGRELWHWRVSAKIIIGVTAAALWTYVVLAKGYAYVLQFDDFSIEVKATLVMAAVTLMAIIPVSLFGLWQSRILNKLP